MILNSIATWIMRKRMHQIELFMKYPHDVQQEWMRKLISTASDTLFGRKYNFSTIATYQQFKEQIPLQEYNDIKVYIDRIRKGEQNILWPTPITWFAKSSGTTSDKSKFIPLTQEALEGCHHNGGRDMVTIYCNNYPDTQLFTGKSLALAGSYQTDNFNGYESINGDLSAIVSSNLPIWAEFLRAPDLSIALLSEWEEKLEKIAKATTHENITSLAGVPSWMLVLLKYILGTSGKKTIAEVWPNLEVFFHGGVNFSPYRELYKEILAIPQMNYLELYNASEGFFGIQFDKDSSDLLLMLDYGIFYEFIPMEEIDNEHPGTLVLGEVQLNKNYAVIISTTAGLWRYKLGDTIKFTSVNPYKFRITGRTRHFINVFGEELIIDNAENALKIACEKTDAIIREYTAGPVYMSNNESGAHEWLVEFEKTPDNLDFFAEVLDNALKTLNSDYEAKRYHNFTLKPPVIRPMPDGTFMNWLKHKNKLGGQHKVPRLANNRDYINEILALHTP